jgi:hypothetical protein
MIKQKRIKLLMIMLLGLFVVVGCTKSSNNNAVKESVDDDAGVIYGIFTDSIVEGVAYETETLCGYTTSEGKFAYIEGETVTFKVGEINLGSIKAKENVTPVDLVAAATDETNETVTNICVLLQTLDVDDDPDNGIEISSATEEKLVCHEVIISNNAANFTTALEAALAEKSIEKTLVARETAQLHMKSTLIKKLAGTYSGSSSGGITFPVDSQIGEIHIILEDNSEWQVTLDENGNLEGSGTCTESATIQETETVYATYSYGLTITGNCTSAGDIVMSTTGSVNVEGIQWSGEYRVTFAGKLDADGNVSGTWDCVNVIGAEQWSTGNFTGSKK